MRIIVPIGFYRATFSAQAQKIKKIKKFTLKNLIFSQKQTFLIFQENETLIFWETELSSFSVANFRISKTEFQ